MNKPNPPASAEKDLHADPNDRTVNTNGADTNYPPEMANEGGFGSPYGGTQTPDSREPDGAQTPANPDAEGKSKKPGDLGEEYGSESSYGEAQSGGKKGENSGTDAAGTPIR